MATEHVDVLIIGAGISGIGAAHHLLHERPGTTFVVLECQEGYGGTWRTHRYPGVRSDSDLYTFGYSFKPWTGAPIATAEEIMTYLGEVIDDDGLDQHIRYRHQIATASWSTEERRWTVTGTRAADDTGTGEDFEVTAGFLWMCQGYYRHAEGYTPEWDGMDDFTGRIVHPQTWPDDLDHVGKRVVVIGSGATAATLIPAMADDVEHITMLQRSPTYFATGRNANELADQLRDLDIPEEWTHEIVRRQILKTQHLVTAMSAEHPEMVKEELGKGIKEILGDDYDLSPHFTPSYRPWQQRIAFVPNGDLFHGIKAGKASVVTDQIVRFTEKGILLESGEELFADIIITATGFEMSVMGDVAFSVDGEPVDFAQTVGYRGTMFTGVPNMAWVFGYFRASWTLRADLIAGFVCRLLARMEEKGASMVVPTLRDEDADMALLPWVDPEDFNPGYLMRALHLMPKQGDREPWRFSQDYWTEKDEFPAIDLDDGTLAYS
ncbi:MAG: flavin-containing monooxygenase [Acidimicrobiia bacterium]